MSSNAALLARLNWIWADQATAFSGGSWVSTDTVSLANLLNTRTQSYARTADVALSSTVLTSTFGAARRIDHAYIGYHNGRDGARGRLLAGPAPLDWTFDDASLPPGMTVARQSGEASWWDGDGVMQWATASGARWDFDPVTGACRGLLIERLGSNLILWTEDLTEWTPTNVTIDDDAAVAPDGDLDMCKLEETSASGAHGVDLAVTWIGGQPVVVSGCAEGAERSWLCVRLYDGTDTRYAWFNVAIGAVGHLSAGLSEARIETVPGGRYRWSVLWTPAAGTGSVGLYLATADGGDALPTYAGTAGYGLLPWGMQAEYTSNNGGSPRPTSYIRQAGSSATRWGDIATLAGDAFVAVVPPGSAAATLALTVAARGAPTSGNPLVGQISDGTVDNRIALYLLSSGGADAQVVAGGSGPTLTASATGVWDGTPQTIAVAVGGGSARLAVGGVLSSPSAATAPTVDRLQLGGGTMGYTAAELFLGAAQVPDAGLTAGSLDMDALDAAYPSLTGWFDLVPTTHVPVDGYIPFGRASAAGKVPSDERDPRGVSRIVVFDPVEATEITLQVDDRNNPAGHFQFSTLWYGMSARPSLGPVAGALTLGPVEESRRRRSLGGTLHARRLWSRRRLTVALEWAQEDEALGTWFETAMRSGGVYPVLFSLLPPTTIGAANQERMTILGVLEEPTPVEHQSVDMYRWAISIVEL